MIDSNDEFSLLGISAAGGSLDYDDFNSNGEYDHLEESYSHLSYLMDLNSYNTEINDYLLAHSIPEPATILGVLPIALFGMFRFLRKRTPKNL